MQALVTTSRMPVAIDLIRKLGKAGHSVIATDTFRMAPGSHSRYVSEAVVTPSPRFDTRGFARAIAHIVETRLIDLILPAFEEVFFLARYRSLYPAHICFFPELDTLLTLHDKARLVDLARALEIPTPASVVVTDRLALAREISARRSYFAKPVYSRGGVALLTNTGPLAGALALDACRPTPAEPWIVQDYATGTDVCSFSVVQHGKITGHCAYVHPREIEHAGGIVFESVNEPVCLQYAERIAKKTRYHGHLSLDFIKTDRGMVLIECNPRPTAGAHVMPDEMWLDALFDREGQHLRVAPPGALGKYSIALVRDMLLHFEEAREDLRHLASDAKEVIADPSDLMPALYQLLSYGHIVAHRRKLASRTHKNRGLMAAYFTDVCANGEDLVQLEERS